MQKKTVLVTIRPWTSMTSTAPCENVHVYQTDAQYSVKMECPELMDPRVIYRVVFKGEDIGNVISKNGCILQIGGSKKTSPQHFEESKSLRIEWWKISKLIDSNEIMCSMKLKGDAGCVHWRDYLNVIQFKIEGVCIIWSPPIVVATLREEKQKEKWMNVVKTFRVPIQDEDDNKKLNDDVEDYGIETDYIRDDKENDQELQCIEMDVITVSSSMEEEEEDRLVYDDYAQVSSSFNIPWTDCMDLYEKSNEVVMEYANYFK